MKLATVHFPSPAGGDRYARMLRALRNSLAANFPAASLEVLSPGAPPESAAAAIEAKPEAKLSFACNTQKMRSWDEWAASIADGELVGLLDADLIVLRPLEDIAARPFDLAMTWRPPGSKFPFNSGVVFARMSPRVREFLSRWRETNDAFLLDADRHQEFRSRYGGINQAALGAMLESHASDGLDILRLDCREWNCEDTTWAAFDPSITRVVHIKSRLRKAVFGEAPATAELQPLVSRWNHHEVSAAPFRDSRPRSPFRPMPSTPRRERWDCILDRLPEGVPLRGAEIGVWRGENAAALLAARPLLHLTLIDPYRTGRPGTDWWESGSTMPMRPQEDYDAARERARTRLEPYADRIKWRTTAPASARYLADGSLDFAWVDGDHSLSGVRRDLEAMWPKVRPGGWIGGHDYGRDQRGAVAEAVHGFFDGLGVVEPDADGTWFVGKQ